MSERVLKGIAHQHNKIKEEVIKVMGGEILEYPAKTFLRQGIEQGKREVICKMLQKGYNCEAIADMLDMDRDAIEKIQQEIR
jgi:hypothetical protein